MMMESSNLNLDLHGHHQEEFHGPSPSFAPTLVPSFHFLNGKDHAWNQDLINCADFTPNSNIGALSSSRDHHFMGNMVQDLGFQWGPLLHSEEDYMVNPSSSSHQVNLSNKDHIKEELLRDYLHLMPSSLHIPPLNSDNNGSLPHMFGGRGSFSMVLPTAIINSSSNSMYSSSLAMGLISNDMGFAYGSDLGRLQEPFMQSPPFSTNNHKIPSSSVSGATKRSSSTMDSSRSCLSVTAKKPRLESRSPFTPFKVRKEKLGDRIAALQQLVAPFGKTDTASVLMEAIGYIKFLQDQVETLSVPYMRSSNNTHLKTIQRASNEEKEEHCKPDLRSRGLCLVPLSCTSYFTNETGGVWAPPNYSGGGVACDGATLIMIMKKLQEGTSLLH